MNPPIPLYGNLSERDFAAVLGGILRQGINGELVVTTPHFVKSVRFSDGKIEFAASNLSDDSYGRFLLRSGVIDLEVFEKSLEIMVRRKIRRGRVLMEMGVLNGETLWRTVAGHLREIVYSLFAVAEGKYEIRHAPTPDGEPENIRIGEPILQIMLEGIRRIEGEEFISRRLEKSCEFFPANPDVRKMPQLAPWELHVLDLVALHPLREAIMEASELLPAETRKTLYALLRLGLITDSPPAPPEARVVESRERIPLFHSFDDALAYFNARYEFIYRLFSKEIGPVAHSILSESITSVLERIPSYFQNIQFGETGKVEEKTILKTVWYLDFQENIAEFLKGLEEMLYAEIFAVKRHLGREYEQQILQWLREAGN